MLGRRMERRAEEVVVDAVLDSEGLLAVQDCVEDIHVAESVGLYAINLVRATRNHQDTLVGASPRGSLSLLLCSRALALIEGRDFVIPEDIKRLAVPALGHRIVIRPELWLNNVAPESVVRAVLEQVPVPDTETL